MPAIESLRDASPEDIQARLDEIRNDFIETHAGNRDLDDDGVRSLVKEADLLDTVLSISKAKENREALNIPATAGPSGDSGFRSAGQAVVSEDFMDLVSKDLPAGWSEVTRGGVRGERQHIASVELKGDDYRSFQNWLALAARYGDEAGVRAAVTEWNTSTGYPNIDPTASGNLLPRAQPIAPVPRRARLFMRDLIPSMPTTYSQIPYVRELNPVTYESAASGGATTVAEGATKPSAQLSFSPQTAPVGTVATTLTMSKQFFQDAPAVVGYVNGRLPYLVRLAEDAQILNGNGTWPNVTGILNSGVQTASGGTSGDYAVQIATGFADVENADGEVTAVVMNPTNAWAMFTKRASTSGIFDAGTPFSALPLSVWGVPTYRSRAYAAGTALVGDFQNGAMIADREGVNLQTYNERYAEQNLVLLICEERLAVLVPRPDLFVNITLNG